MYPVLFTIPVVDIPIYSYGVMLGLSLVVGWVIVMHLGAKDGLPKDRMAWTFIWTAVAAMIGARVLYILTNLEQYTGPGAKSIFELTSSGLVAYGGFLGGFVGSWLYLRRARIRLLPWADVVVPTLASGLGITRIGCFLYGCDYGRPIPDDAPAFIKAVGLRFPNWEAAYPEMKARVSESAVGAMAPVDGAPAFLHHVHDHLVSSDALTSALVYPTQLMAVLNGWVAFAILMLFRKRKKFHGQVFLLFTAYYGLTRSLMELVRGDTGRGGLGVLSTSQIVGISTFVAAVAAWILLSRWAKKNPQAAMALGPGAAPIPAPDKPSEKKPARKPKAKKKRR